MRTGAPKSAPSGVWPASIAAASHAPTASSNAYPPPLVLFTGSTDVTAPSVAPTGPIQVIDQRSRSLASIGGIHTTWTEGAADKPSSCGGRRGPAPKSYSAFIPQL